ncbi:MAG TPA: prepilin peptidase [Urbifossiella sp.]|nr:prepilin peptidase [Urbifossiella sp.]
MPELLTQPTPTAAPAARDDSLGIDREFVTQMARMPALALVWVAAGAAAHQLWALAAPATTNYGPLVVICAGMVLAAFIDGWALKVPNWVTMPLVLSGWMLGILHDLNVPVDSGTGGFTLSLLGTGLGLALLLPILLIGGVGAGDVKMQMGFGAWVGAYFGATGPTGPADLSNLHTAGVVFWAFAFGAIAGGAFGLVMILMRRKWGANVNMVREIFTDLQLIASGSPRVAADRAQDRRKIWDKLPYGIPLCVGFLLYLAYVLPFAG